MRKTAGNLLGAVGGLVILTLISPLGCRRGASPSPELQSLLAADTLDRQVGDAVIRSSVRAFYAKTGGALAWTRNTPTKLADQALAVVASSRDHGLDPETYQLAALTSERDVLARESKTQERLALAVFDVRLTAALLRVGRDVAIGRVSPQRVDRRWKLRRQMPDLAATLFDSLADGSDWLERIQPRHPEYVALKRGLAALRGVEEKGGWPMVPPRGLATGASGPAVIALRQRLAASGDLDKAAVHSKRFDVVLERAVGTFQDHQGLPATGRLDASTIAALNVPLASRIRQVALNLERWRWLPDQLGERHFRVNIPQFHLEAYEGGKRVVDIRAVVGKPGNETPILSERMTHVVMSPYWNIPSRIAADETRPAVSADPGYLDRQDIEVVRVSDGQASVVDPATLDWDDDVALEGLRFRQRPGATNALGLVKFMFPNDYDVYVHDTPADALFARLGRAFSHGCVRVEDPLTLAMYVLRDQPRWTREAITAAMHGGTETHVKLRQAISIHIMYLTSWVDPGGGLQFRQDIYGYDRKQAAMETLAGPRRREGEQADVNDVVLSPKAGPGAVTGG